MLKPLSEKSGLPQDVPAFLPAFLVLDRGVDVPAFFCREIKNQKPGYIPATTPPILRRLQMDAAPVLAYLAKNDLPSPGAIGPIGKLRAFAESVGRKFIKGHVLCNGFDVT